MPLARCLVVFLGIGTTGIGVLSATAGAASAGDPLQSTGCRRAVAVLQAREADAASAAASAGPAARSGANPDLRLVAARQQAAVACLATRPDPPRLAEATRPPDAPLAAAASGTGGRPSALLPGRLAQPPIAVAPVAGAAPTRPPAAPAAAAPTPSLPPTGPRFITSCDPGGCWADDGSRLDRVGPNLWGRGGACSVLGSVVTCR